MRDTCDECGGPLGALVEDDDPPVFCNEECYERFDRREKAERKRQ